MAAALSIDKAIANNRLDRAEQLKVLRHKIAAVSGKTGRGHSASYATGELLPQAESLLPIPESLAVRLPVGLPRGSVVVASGARSLPLAVAAGVTAAGGHFALVRPPHQRRVAPRGMGAAR